MTSPPALERQAALVDLMRADRAIMDQNHRKHDRAWDEDRKQAKRGRPRKAKEPASEQAP